SWTPRDRTGTSRRLRRDLLGFSGNGWGPPHGSLAAGCAIARPPFGVSRAPIVGGIGPTAVGFARGSGASLARSGNGPLTFHHLLPIVRFEGAKERERQRVSSTGSNRVGGQVGAHELSALL